MNKFEVREKYQRLEPKVFLKSLLKEKDIVGNDVLKQFIKMILDKIKEYELLNKIGILRSIMPSISKKDKNEVVDAGTYDYTRTVQFDDRMNKLISSIGLGEEYSSKENIEKYNLLKNYLEYSGKVKDIKKSNVFMVNPECISVDNKGYGFMSKEDYQHFCVFLGNKDEFNKLLKEDFFLVHSKKPDVYIVDAENEKYKEYLFNKNIEQIEEAQYDGPKDEVDKKSQYESMVDEVEENKTLMLEVGFISDDRFRYNYETGTIVNCYEQSCDEMVIPDSVTRYEYDVENDMSKLKEKITPIREINMIAFAGIEIQRLVIPATIENINIDDETNLSNIKNIEIASNNKNYRMIDNVLCNRQGEPLRKNDYTTDKLIKMLDTMTDKSLIENGSMEKKEFQLSDGSVLEIALSANWKQAEMDVKTAISLRQNNGEREIIFTNSDYEYNSPLAKESLSNITNIINERGIQKTHEDTVKHIDPVVRTFKESLNRETKKDYGLRENYYIIDTKNPGNYIEMNSCRYKFKGQEETETRYKVFRDDQEVGKFSDRKHDGWEVKDWTELREKMQHIGNFSDYIAKVYNKKDFIRYKEQLVMDNIESKSNTEDHQSVIKDITPEKQQPVLIDDLREILEKHNIDIAMYSEILPISRNDYEEFKKVVNDLSDINLDSNLLIEKNEQDPIMILKKNDELIQLYDCYKVGKENRQLDIDEYLR